MKNKRIHQAFCAFLVLLVLASAMPAGAFAAGGAPALLSVSASRQRFTVTFDSNGGSRVKRQTASSGAKLTRPRTPTKGGYTFDGWYSDPELQNEWDFSYDTARRKMTLYAKWKSDDHYEVRFNSGGRSTVKTQSVKKNARVIEPDDPTASGYTFVAWYTDKSFKTKWNFSKDRATRDMTLYAGWKKGAVTTSKYTVSFNSMGGGSVKAQSVNKNGYAVEPKDPTRSGYAFTGWYRDRNLAVRWDFDRDRVTGNRTLYAGWKSSGSGSTTGSSAQYTVSFNSMGGGSVKAQSVNKNGYVVEPKDPKRDGYVFSGWYGDRNTNVPWDFNYDRVTGNMTLYAGWSSDATGYSVTFDSAGGTSVKAQTVRKGGFVVEPKDPKKDGCTFDGWFSDRNLNNRWSFDADAVTGDMTLYAGWTQINSAPLGNESGGPVAGPPGNFLPGAL